MNIAVCDDDERELKRLHQRISQWGSSQGRIAEVHTFSQGEALCNAVLDGREYDLFILDILMPGMDGMALAKNLRSSPNVAGGTPIVFLTSSRDYAIESYEVRAFHYLLKPVDADKMFGVLDAAAKSVQKRADDVVLVRTKDGAHYVNRADICYMEYCSRSIVFVCAETTLTSLSVQGSFRGGTSDFDADARFFRCGASFIVNLSAIRSVDKSTVRFANGMKLEIPRASAKELFRSWLDYHFE